MRQQKLSGRSFAFAEPPPIGIAVTIAGQRYDLVDAEPYRRQDGEDAEISVWMATCRGCGREFLSKSPRLRFPEVRTCAECRPTKQGTS